MSLYTLYQKGLCGLSISHIGSRCEKMYTGQETSCVQKDERVDGQTDRLITLVAHRALHPHSVKSVQHFKCHNST